MFGLTLGIATRIVSNSYLNVFQKVLNNRGEYPSIINFYTYLGLTVIGFAICPNPIFTSEIIKSFFIMGLLGALGNYFIIKALRFGELSSLAPINSYKPIVALIIAFFMLKETPNLNAILGILLIIAGTFILYPKKINYSKACFYRFLALIFSGSEAVFIKKIILLSDIPSSFLYWALASFIFTIIFVIFSKHKPVLQKSNLKYQLSLILMVFLMQYSTNFIFSKMNVAYALAIFQLSTILSVFLGANIFNEGNLLRKFIASLIMVLGAVVLILFC